MVMYERFKMRNYGICIAVLFASSLTVSTAHADVASEFLCKQGKSERKVSLVYPEAGKKSPCEVHYLKGTDDKIIFSAKNEAGFCEKHDDDFVAKLKGMAYSCEATQGAVTKQ
jgi:hypothetical protein